MKIVAVAVMLTSPLLAMVFAVFAGVSFFVIALGCAWRAAKELWGRNGRAA
jgi:hypothetical protein